MAAITCPTDCSGAIPTVLFSDCNPEINGSEITDVYLSKGNSAPLTTWSAATEWTTRMGTPTDPDDKIIELKVSGEKPAPGKQEIDISQFRKFTVTKNHVLNATIDETNQTNYDFARNIECGGTYRLWYKTASGHLHGGNEGVLASLDANVVLAKGENSIAIIELVAQWSAKHTEERVVSPI